MKKLSLERIVILVLIAIIILSVIFRSKLAERLGYSNEVVTQLVEVEASIRQSMLDSLNMIPALQKEKKQINAELEGVKLQLAIIQQEEDEQHEEVDDHSLQEDVEYFADYLELDTIPKIIPVDNRFYVALFPDHLKKTNHIFVGHTALVKKNKELNNIIELHEKKHEANKREIALLESAIIDCQDLDQNLQLQLVEKDNQIKIQRKQKRRRTWGMVGGALVGVGIGAIIFGQ